MLNHFKFIDMQYKKQMLSYHKYQNRNRVCCIALVIFIYLIVNPSNIEVVVYVIVLFKKFKNTCSIFDIDLNSMTEMLE